MYVAFLAQFAIFVMRSRCASATKTPASDLECSLRMQQIAIDALYSHLTGRDNSKALADAIQQARKSCVDIITCSKSPKVAEIAQRQLKSIDGIDAIPEDGLHSAIETARSILRDLDEMHKNIVSLSLPCGLSQEEKRALLRKVICCRLGIIHAMRGYSEMIEGGCSGNLIDVFEKQLEWVSNNITDLEIHTSWIYNDKPRSYGCKRMVELIREEKVCMAKIQELCKDLRSDNESVSFQAINELGEQLMRVEDAHDALSRIFRQLAKRLTNAELTMVNDEEKDYNPEYHDIYDTMDPKHGSTTRQTRVFGFNDKVLLPINLPRS